MHFESLLFQVKTFPLNSSKLEEKTKRNEIVRPRTCGLLLIDSRHWFLRIIVYLRNAHL
jgi:hypothetical protein